MITLRVLKKKSKQAREILIAHYGYKPKKFFPAERGDAYHGLRVRCDHLKKPGRFTCQCQSTALKGTPMAGEMSGYYEPEWEERTALEELRRKIEWEPRPNRMSDKEWRRALAISGVRPITEAEIDAWAREDFDCEAVD